MGKDIKKPTRPVNSAAIGMVSNIGNPRPSSAELR
jgi:hypothetical protein